MACVADPIETREDVTSAKPARSQARTYGIGHLSREFGVTPRTLRYYEQLELLTPSRQAGARRYSKKDRDRLIFILQGRAMGMPLAEVADLLHLYERRDGTTQQKNVLSIFTQRLQLLQARRDAAEQGIEMLQSAIAQLSAPAPDQGREATSRAPSRTRLAPIVADRPSGGRARSDAGPPAARFTASPDKSLLHGG